MNVFAAILVLALTRAELIERFRTPPVTQVEGLVQVYADCPADMRREYQVPVARYAADICRRLYQARAAPHRRFDDPGIIVHIGAVRTNIADVVVSTDTRANGDRFMRIKLPAPGYSDMDALRLAIVRGFYLALRGEELDDAGAALALRSTDPALRLEDERAELKRWRELGVAAEGHDDEYYLKQLRKVSNPGHASREDVAVFASRLMLYPPYYSLPFCGRFTGCTFRDAIELSKTDPVVRLAAVKKSRELLVFGGGRGDRMTAAAQAYSDFLVELARGKISAEELGTMLSEADDKLKEVLQ